MQILYMHGLVFIEHCVSPKMSSVETIYLAPWYSNHVDIIAET